jgi:putative transposase
MTNVTMKLEQPQTDATVHLFDNWFDPIEAGLRDRVREFIHAMVAGELYIALSRPRYARCAKASSGEAEGAGGRHRRG